MINILIFSKDRPSQLDLLCRSIKYFWTDYSKYKFLILYTYSNTQYQQGYDITIKRHPEFYFIKEASFKLQVQAAINDYSPLTIFFTDDCVFKEPFTLQCNELEVFKYNADILCLSLRLSPLLSHSYVVDKPMPLPIFITRYIWHISNATLDWTYPMSLDGTIFRTVDIQPLINRLPYWNPNTLEAYLMHNPIKKSLMSCFHKSPIMNIPANRVQTTYMNKCGETPAEYLNKEYLNGKIISLKNIEHFENISVHQEVEFKLIEGE